MFYLTKKQLLEQIKKYERLKFYNNYYTIHQA